MLLRRMVNHVKSQNWTAVGLDFLIVVLGVFLGIQLGNWNDARLAAGEEARYLRDLKSDLASDIGELERMKNVASLRFAAAEYLLREIGEDRPGFESIPMLVEPPKVEEPPEFDGYVHTYLINTIFLDSNENTFEELVATGNLAVLKNAALVSKLNEYYDALIAREQGDLVVRHRYFAVTDFLIEAGCSPAGRCSIETLRAGFTSQPKGPALLRVTREGAMIHAAAASDLLASAQEVTAMIDVELGNR